VNDERAAHYERLSLIPRGREPLGPRPSPLLAEGSGYLTREESAGTAGIGNESALVHRANHVRAFRDRHNPILRPFNPNHVAHAIPSEDSEQIRFA
jgi:hypothetical protein